MLRRVLLVLALPVLASGPALAQRAPFGPDGEPLSGPYFDVRQTGDGPTTAVRQAVAAARTPERLAEREADVARLASQVLELRIQDDDLFGTPHFVRSTRQMLTEPAAGAWTPAGVVADFVAAYPALFEVDSGELALARRARDYVTRHNGVTHLTFQQQIDGVDLWGAEVKANVSRLGELINVSSTMLPRPEGGFETPAIAIGPADALRLAAADVGITLASAPRPVTAPEGARMKQTWAPMPELRSGEAITSELLWFPLTRDEIRPAWRVVVPEPGIGNTYETTVDAVDGRVLRRWNRLHFLGGTEDITFNVWVDDSPAPGSPGSDTPDGTQFPEVPRTLVTVTPADVAGLSPDSWIDDGDNETFGNNVDAHLDLNADNNPDLPRPQGSPFRVFDFAVDLDNAPSTYRDHAVTQLFYYCNVFHDRLYALGWDEAASNFQDDNFGNGGAGGDRLQADAQDGSGTNNANFSGSGSDGTSGRIQMFIFDGPSPDLDGDLDGDVVYHEYAHGLSIRLSGGTVFGEQAGGMGEGWSDYFGIALNAQAGDDPHAVYPMGGYVTFGLGGLTDNYYFGIRRYPYSTDLNKAPQTYADIDPGQISFPGGVPASPIIGGSADEVHNVGEIWCLAVLEARANLWDEMGFPANELMMQLVVDGLKLMPSTPNMLEARDAILEADLVNNGGSNLGALWTGFAKRGMGASASSPSGSTTTGIVEAFDVPVLIGFEYPNGQPSQLQPGTETTFPVNVTALAGDQPIPGTGTLTYSVNGGGAVTVPMNETAANEYEATLPALACLDVVDFFVTVDSTGGMVSSPSGAPAETFSAEVFSSITTLVADDFEVASGWTVGAPGDDATTGVWERGDPVGTSAQPEDDNTAGGTDCFFTGQGVPGGGLGDNDVDGGQTTLTSPVFDLSSSPDARIQYYRWYSNDTGASPNADVFVVDVSNDGGGSWVNAETVGPAGPGTSGGWIFHEFTVSDFVTPTASVRVRFIASDEADGSLVEAAVDDFGIIQPECDVVCQTDLGFGGPGDLAIELCGEALSSGNSATMTATNANPGETIFFAVGLADNPTPFKGGQLVPVPVDLTLTVPADGSGAASFVVPGGNGPVTLFVQAVAADAAQPVGFEISNALEVFFDA